MLLQARSIVALTLTASLTAGVHAQSSSGDSDTVAGVIPADEHAQWRIADVDLETRRVLLEDQPLTIHASTPIGGEGVTFFSQTFGREIVVMYNAEPLVLRRALSSKEDDLRFETDNYAIDSEGYVTSGAHAKIHVNEADGLLLTLSTPDEPMYRVAMTIHGLVLDGETVCRCVISPTENYAGCSARGCELSTTCKHGTKRGECGPVLKRGTEADLPLEDPDTP